MANTIFPIKVFDLLSLQPAKKVVPGIDEYDIWSLVMRGVSCVMTRERKRETELLDYWAWLQEQHLGATTMVRTPDGDGLISGLLRYPESLRPLRESRENGKKLLFFQVNEPADRLLKSLGIGWDATANTPPQAAAELDTIVGMYEFLEQKVGLSGVLPEPRYLVSERDQILDRVQRVLNDVSSADAVKIQRVDLAGGAGTCLVKRAGATFEVKPIDDFLKKWTEATGEIFLITPTSLCFTPIAFHFDLATRELKRVVIRGETPERIHVTSALFWEHFPEDIIPARAMEQLLEIMTSIIEVVRNAGATQGPFGINVNLESHNGLGTHGRVATPFGNAVIVQINRRCSVEDISGDLAEQLDRPACVLQGMIELPPALSSFHALANAAGPFLYSHDRRSGAIFRLPYPNNRGNTSFPMRTQFTIDATSYTAALRLYGAITHQLCGQQP